MLQLRHPQIGDGAEVGGHAEAPGLLLQAVDRLDVGIAAVVDHSGHHRVEAFLDGGGQFLEGFEPAATRPPKPAPKVDGDWLGVLVHPRCAIDGLQRDLQPPGLSAFELGVLQPVHGIDLRLAPARRVTPLTPHQPLERLAVAVAQRPAHRRGLVAHLGTAQQVPRLVGHHDDVEAVVADLRLPQRQDGPLGRGRAHVHAHVPNLGGITAVCLQVDSEVDHRMVLPSLGGEQQPLGIHVEHHGDVVMATTQEVCHIEAHALHAGKRLQGSRLVPVELDAPPPLLVRAAQQAGRLTHRQLPAQHQRHGLESASEAPSRPGPRHRRLAAASAGDWYVAVQPWLELQEVQVASRVARAIVNRLWNGTGRAR